MQEILNRQFQGTGQAAPQVQHFDKNMKPIEQSEAAGAIADNAEILRSLLPNPPTPRDQHHGSVGSKARSRSIPAGGGYGGGAQPLDSDAGGARDRVDSEMERVLEANQALNDEVRRLRLGNDANGKPVRDKDNNRLVKHEKDKLIYSKAPRKGIKVERKLGKMPKELPKELGKLGADLDNDDLLYKKACNIRVKEFSNQLRDVNKKMIDHTKARRRANSVAAVGSSVNRSKNAGAGAGDGEGANANNWRDRSKQYAEKVRRQEAEMRAGSKGSAGGGGARLKTEVGSKPRVAALSPKSNARKIREQQRAEEFENHAHYVEEHGPVHNPDGNDEKWDDMEAMLAQHEADRAAVGQVKATVGLGGGGGAAGGARGGIAPPLPAAMVGANVGGGGGTGWETGQDEYYGGEDDY